MKDRTENTSKETGFRVPEGYFDGISDKVFNTIHFNDVSELPKNDGFKVPEGYFESVENAVESHLKNDESGTVIPFNYKKTLYYISGIAAALVIYFSVLTKNQNSSEVTVEMVQSYFEYKNMDSYELAELLIESDLINIEDVNIQSSIDDDELEAYLLEHANLEQIISQ
jgi:hypothetical protein